MDAPISDEVVFTMSRSAKITLVILGSLSVVFILALGAVSFSNPQPDWSTDLNLSATAGSGYAELTWSTTATNVYEFSIYRSTTPEFGAFSENLYTTLKGNVLSYRDNNVVGRTTYYYKVRAKNTTGLSNPSNEVNVTPIAVNPHDRLLYEGNSDICRACHLTHTGKGPKIITHNFEVDLCLSCHDATGQSKFDVQKDFAKSGSVHPVNQPSGSGISLTCKSCHNPHGDWDSTNARTYPMILRSQKVTVAVYESVYQGDDVCWSCHGSNSTYKAPYGDHQTYYPENTANPLNPNLTGTGHGSSVLESVYGTKITCTACHNQHGSQLPKLLQENISFSYDGGASKITTSPQGNDKSLCFACHKQKNTLNTRPDYGWDGQAVYEDTTTDDQGNQVHNGHEGDCKLCHEVHGTENSRYLRARYDVVYSAQRSKAYDGSDYVLCFSCHNPDDLMGTDGSTTKFYNKDDSNPNRRNLHYLHLRENGENGKGYATCKECHRPHGALSSENPSLKHKVGFPATTVTANDYPAPRFIEQPGGGSCNLRCHGREHKEDNFKYTR